MSPRRDIAPVRRTLPALVRARLSRGRRALAVRTRDDRAFLPAALEIIETPAAPARVAFLWLLCAIVVAALAWGWLTTLDIYTVAPGRIGYAGRSKVVQPFEPGRVQAILVQNGQRVEAGEPLVVVDRTEAQADVATKTQELQALDAEIVRRTAVVAAMSGGVRQPILAFPASVPAVLRAHETAMLAAELGRVRTARDNLDAQIAENAARRARLDMSIASRTSLVATLQERIDMRSKLIEHGAGSRASVLDAVQAMQQEATNLTAERGQAIEAAADRVVLERKRDQTLSEFVLDQMNRIDDARTKRVAVEEDLVKAEARAARTRLVAPIAGTVQQLAVTTIGQVVGSGEPLMLIVPSDGTLQVEALVQNREIGFVAPGQTVTVKVDAFPFTRYGTLRGTVVRVSRDAVDEREAQAGGDGLSLARGQGLSKAAGTSGTQSLVFPITIALDQPFLAAGATRVPLSPGMTISAEIRTGSRRALDYLLAPLRETAGGAAHED